MERLTFNGNFCDIAVYQEERGGAVTGSAQTVTVEITLTR